MSDHTQQKLYNQTVASTAVQLLTKYKIYSSNSFWDIKNQKSWKLIEKKHFREPHFSHNWFSDSFKSNHDISFKTKKTYWSTVFFQIPTADLLFQRSVGLAWLKLNKNYMTKLQFPWMSNYLQKSKTITWPLLEILATCYFRAYRTCPSMPDHA